MQCFKSNSNIWIILALMILVILLLYGFGLAIDEQTNKLNQTRNIVEIVTERELDKIPLSLEDLHSGSSIAVLITELDENKALLAELTKLPVQVAFGFVPEASIASEIEMLRNKGHDVFIKMAFSHLQHADNTDVYQLNNYFPVQENIKRLTFLIQKFSDITGVYSYDLPINDIHPLMDLLSVFQLCYVSDKLASSSLESYAKTTEFPLIISNNVIDKQVQDITRELELAEISSKKYGLAVILLQVDISKVTIVGNWIKTLHNKNIKLIAISKLLTKNYI